MKYISSKLTTLPFVVVVRLRNNKKILKSAIIIYLFLFKTLKFKHFTLSFIANMKKKTINDFIVSLKSFQPDEEEIPIFVAWEADWAENFSAAL